MTDIPKDNPAAAAQMALYSGYARPGVDSHQSLLNSIAADLRSLFGFHDAPVPVDDPPGRGLPPCCITIDDDGTARWL